MRSLLAQLSPVPGATRANAQEQQVFEAGEELLVAGVGREETGDGRIDYLTQEREAIGVKAATTVTGGST